MVNLTDYLNKIEETEKRNDRIGIIGDLFLETHELAGDKEKIDRHKRIARLLKINYDDYYELAKTIHCTGLRNIKGSHWDYITAVMRNKRHGNTRQ